jgi:hypothetical protein
MNDEVLTLLTDRFSELDMKTPLDEIYARGRRHRKARRLTTAIAAGAVAAVGAGVTAVAVAPASHPANGGSPQLTAFSISAGANGTSALTLRKGEQYRLDPVALRQALAQHGIPALVTVGQACDSGPEPAGLDQAVTPQRHADGSVTLTINPTAMPPASELSIGYFPSKTVFALIQRGAPIHCSATPGGHGGTALVPSSFA